MARRGPSEGSIGRRKDGRWQVRVELGADALGKRRRKYFYAASEREAVKLLRQAQRDKERGVLTATSREAPKTLGAWLDEWLETIKATREPKTYAGYESTARVHVKPALGRIRLDRLEPGQVQRFLLAKLEAGQSPWSVKRMQVLLSTALSKAVRRGYAPRNVASAEELELPPLEPRTDNVLSLEEAHRFLAAVREDRLYALYLTALALGIRQAHLLGLRWQDVDWEARRLHIRYKLDRVGEEWQLRPIRGSRTKRTRASLPLLDPVAEALSEHRAQQQLEREAAGADWNDLEYEGREVDLIFRGRTGKPLTRPSVTKGFQRRLHDAGVARLRFHDLRHSAASVMMGPLRIPIKTVSEVLGHSSISITADLYGHLADELLREQLSGLGPAWTIERPQREEGVK